MQSPQHKTQRSFNSILPSIKKPSTERKTTYELNNEGCKCELCQKIIINENMKIMAEQINDMESEGFTKDRPKEHFIPLIEQIVNKWKYKRTIRFCLPQILLYEHGHPVAIVQKKKQTSSIIINKSKSRLHFFQIQNFFLTSFISHSPTKKARSSKTQAISKPYLNECIIFAKYENNVYRMMTYKQIQDMFRSKNKAMKDGLMYLQTVVGGDGFKSITIIVKLDEIDTNEQMKTLFQRAKAEVKIITGEIKLIDVQYFQENQQIQFQNQLKNYDMNRYLLYLSYKFILISSKINSQIMKHSIFKFAVVDKKVFLFDLRVKQFGSGVKYWSSNVLQALQIKIQKTMSLMELEKGQKEDRYKVFENKLSSKARQLSEWLNASTQQEWDQMKIIRRRLQKLQQQKKSLQKSQKQQEMRKSFKMRNIQSKKNKQKNDAKVEYSFNF